ncbi:MAG: IS200/IS605 family transposase [Bacteroidia bacterium]|nr:IS200/IS605 family transposase [Bacteroidia bacterium]
MKPGVYTQLYTQLVFAVKYRECLLTESIRNEVFSNMSDLLTNKKHKTIIINGYLDHVHVFLSINPTVSISDVVSDLKRSSSLFINDKKLVKGKFQWQEGYGAFSYSKSHVENVYNYILNQKEHHQKRPFREEYLDLLKKFDVVYDDRFLFEFFDNV